MDQDVNISDTNVEISIIDANPNIDIDIQDSITFWEQIYGDPKKSSSLVAFIDSKIEEAKEKSFIFEQSIPESNWTIEHTLNKLFPSVAIVDSAGTYVVGEVQYINENTIKVYFNSAFSGKAYLN